MRVNAAVGECGLGRVAAAGLILAASLARAQEQPVDPLRGPAVKERQAPATLVQREMSGAMVRLETRPEQAALDLLGLSKEERAAADKVIAERAALVNKLLAEHYDLFQKIVTARQGGAPREELAPLVREFRKEAAPLFEGEPFADRVGAALPKEKAERFAALVEEYKRAEAAEGEKQGEAPPPWGRGAAARVETNLALREMGRALRAIVQDRRERTEELIKKLDATPEQEEKIRSIIRETGSKNGFVTELNEDRRRELMDKVLAVLTPEQRKAAVEKLRAR